jgi:hypothetical protein
MYIYACVWSMFEALVSILLLPLTPCQEDGCISADTIRAALPDWVVGNLFPRGFEVRVVLLTIVCWWGSVCADF